MTHPIEVLDDLAIKSLSEGQSKEDWLNYLRDFREAIDTVIENVENKIDRDLKK